MPELPEVETVKRELAARLIGRHFKAVAVNEPRLVQGMEAEEFCRLLIGKRIEELTRRGKYLLFHLSGGYILVLHLRMTGALLFDPIEINRFARAVFLFEHGTQLVFNDIRRFGTARLVRDEAEAVGKLGIEPLCEEFTPAALEKLFKGRKTSVKAVILNQELIAGIGNMYADEALFGARIHPARSAGSLKKKEIEALHRTIVEVLKQAIEDKGASVRDYRTPGGASGTAHFRFMVAHRRGEKCMVCGGPVERAVIAGRGTYFCPKCQG